MDGLSSVQYSLHSVTPYPLYTNISVELPGPAGDQDLHAWLIRDVQDLTDRVPSLTERNRTRTLLNDYMFTNKWQIWLYMKRKKARVRVNVKHRPSNVSYAHGGADLEPVEIYRPKKLQKPNKKK